MKRLIRLISEMCSKGFLVRGLVYMFILHSSVQPACSQDLADFFSQKKKDIQYMLQQIAALQVYIGYAEKGYQVARDGLTTIGQFKKGEFDLHSVFFASLRSINPAVTKYSKVTVILTLQPDIVHAFKNAIRTMQLSGRFTPAELAYVNLVYDHILQQGGQSLSALLDILGSGEFGMKDNERIKRIDDLYADMKNQYAFTRSFTSQAVLLGAQRANGNHDNDFLQKLY